MVKRKSYILGEIIEVEEYHDGKYGAPGMKRAKKKKATPEQVAKINQYNKEKKCRRRLRKYFDENDYLATLTYRKGQRPPNINEAKKNFTKFLREIRKIYKKNNTELRWIRNIENTTRGNYHIHLVIKDIPNVNLLRELNKAWPYGAVHDPKPLYKRGHFKDLAAYLTKDEDSTRESLGEIMDHKVTEASYSVSRNMPLPPPKEKIMKRWQKEVREKKGYYIDKESYFEGINPVTGYRYRHYTLIRNTEVKRRI